MSPSSFLSPLFSWWVGASVNRVSMVRPPVTMWALPSVLLVGALVAAHRCRCSSHQSWNPMSLKHPSLVCRVPPQWVHFRWILSSLSRRNEVLSYRYLASNLLPISEGFTLGDEAWDMIPHRAISRRIVAYAASRVGNGSWFNKSRHSWSKSVVYTG